MRRNNLQAKDSHKRSLAKTISWRIVATLLTIIILYFFTKNIQFSGGVGILINFVKTLGYFIHERLWEKIRWGRKIV